MGTLGAFSNRVLTFLVEVLKNKDLQDLVEVADGGSIQVLLAVVKGVPHRRKRSRNEMENPDPSVEKWYVVIQNEPHMQARPEVLNLIRVTL